MNLDFWRNNKRRSLWQHPLWQKFQEAIGRKTWTIETSGAQALVIKRAMPFGLNWLEVPRGPLFNTKEDLVEIIGQIKKLGEDQGSVFIRMSCYDPEITKIPFLRIRNYDNHPSTSLIMDLSLTEEQLLEQMKQKGRYNIKVAQKHEIRVATSQDVEIFYHLLQMTAERDGFKLHVQSHYKALLDSLGENVQMLVAYFKERPVAAGLFVYLDEWGIYYYGASDHHYRNLMAPYLLQWEGILEAKRRSCKFYDFLGISPEGSHGHRWAGVTEFKTKFGGQVKNYPQARELVLRPWLYWMYRVYKRMR